MSTEGSFIWCDLSAYRPLVAQAFHAAVLGWDFHEEGGYAYGSLDETPVAAIYQMPPKFMDMGLPSFWMSYIAVEDVARTVELARAQGGRVELAADDHALIRDPLGAGFTVHSAALEEFGPPRQGVGQRTGHDLFCSDISVVAPFYEALFGWKFDRTEPNCHVIRSRTGAPLALAHELPDEQRGKEQYWAVRFGVWDLAASTERAREAGAADLLPVQLPDGPSTFLFDPDGAAFLIEEVTG
ncbi:MAG: VOC family protein [Pseudomonadota bacterium]